jgi:hypothetical protein
MPGGLSVLQPELSVPQLEQCILYSQLVEQGFRVLQIGGIESPP